ncbi:hypothetical protein [Aneurinibacillus danicus]|uniref:hypothetical protein n=1 Tax=Aneurinibacillus danicus TaxID=267746 RepID=UPI0014794F94|nr:hypothetical protein [Aneurinibacillus danicus]
MIWSILLWASAAFFLTSIILSIVAVLKESPKFHMLLIASLIALNVFLFSARSILS